MESVIEITALSDNYIYIYRYGKNNAFVVDPGDARSVFNELEKYNISLTYIFITHHHYDHTGGVQELKKKTGSKLVSSEKAEILHIGEVNIKTIPTPGHTRDSVCYYIEPSKQDHGILFTGDTLFIGGCGRPMECDSSTMWSSLKKLKALPDETVVYPGHDYTEENYEFALTIEPHNLLEVSQNSSHTLNALLCLHKEANM